jgi:hypothetical protein
MESANTDTVAIATVADGGRPPRRSHATIHCKLGRGFSTLVAERGTCCMSSHRLCPTSRSLV